MAVRYSRAAHTVRANDTTLPENFSTLDPDFDGWEETVTSANNSRMAANNIVTPQGPETATPLFSPVQQAGTRDLEQRNYYYSAPSSPACIDLFWQRG
jgi:hypothetical protein